MQGRNNSFDLIRHFAAYLVLFSHHFALSKLTEPTVPHWDTLGFVAVAMFFAISGYFMPQSYSASSGFIPFLEKRCRRIFPGLIFCSFIMVYVIGLFFTDKGKIDYIFDYEQIKNFFSTSLFIGNAIPSVFSDFLYRDAINGSLWTLPVEFLCYLIIGSVLSIAFSWKSITILLWVACIATATRNQVWTDFSFYAIPMSYLSLFGISFFTGALMSMTKTSWLDKRIPFVIMAIVFIWIFRGRPEIQVLGTAGIAVLTIIIGVSFKDKIINGRFDISYGVYIYAFPIQQIVINRVTSEFWLSMFLSVILTTIVGFISYKYIESPFIRARTVRNLP